jgi:hypothetical protein
LSQYGVIGTVIFMSLWVFSIYIAATLLLKSRNLDSLDRVLLCYSVSTLILIFVSMFHSGALQRKAIYPLFTLAVGIVWRYRRLDRASGQSVAVR